MGNCSPKEEKGAFVFGFAKQRKTEKRQQANGATARHRLAFPRRRSRFQKKRVGALSFIIAGGGSDNDGKSSLVDTKTLRILPGDRPIGRHEKKGTALFKKPRDITARGAL